MKQNYFNIVRFDNSFVISKLQSLVISFITVVKNIIILYIFKTIFIRLIRLVLVKTFNWTTVRVCIVNSENVTKHFFKISARTPKWAV